MNRIEHQYDRKGEPTEWDGGVANEATPAAPALAEAPRAAAGGAGGTRGIVPLKIGDAVVPLSVAGTTEEIGRARAAASSADEAERESPWTAPDLELIETRCRLKARSCELFVARNAAAGDPERMRAVHESISSVLREAKATRDCFLWVLWREREQPTDRAVSRIGRCYLALAEAAALMRRVDAAGERAGDEAVASAMQLLAEADSALRVALSETWLTVPDRDQDETHLWLKHETAWRRVFLERYMTISDPGDPARADDVIREASAISERVAKRIASSKSVDSALTKLRYHVNKAEADAEEYHFERIIASLEALAALGVSARDRRVVEALPPAVIDAMPERLREHAAVQGVLSARRKPTPGEETVKERAWSARVQEARGLVEGRSLVMVGGEPRNEAIERLKRAFGLSRVEWVHLSEHGSSEGLRGPISRPETAAVLVLIKLTGHLHAEEAQRYARSAGKPWIYLTAGYNPEQVAEALLQQAGERLREVANERVVS
ncbi:MAG: hypothetical protein JNK58_04065 [Phycisphaerae bacterium]|nr:hypothetical protein [Phycisphaerae bacterium]